MFDFIAKIFSIKSLTDLLKDRIVNTFRESFDNTNKKFGYSSKPNPDVIDYLEQREIILSKKTMDRLHGDLKFQLLEGINNKESITEIKKRIGPLFDNMKDFEIERIARTEVLHASNAGTLHAFEEIGIVKYKMWQANIKNPRTADDSKRLHNQIQLLDDPFVDPNGKGSCNHPPNRPNCRCTIVGLTELPKKTKKVNGILYKVD